MSMGGHELPSLSERKYDTRSTDIVFFFTADADILDIILFIIIN